MPTALLLLALAALGPVKVASTTHDRAYLGAGEGRGLAVGVEAVLVRRSRSVARCRIDLSTLRSASCPLPVGHEVEVGDLARFEPAARTAPAPVTVSSTVGPHRAEPPPVDFAAVAYAPVDGPREASSVAARPISAAARLSHWIHARATTSGGLFSRTELDLAGAVPLGVLGLAARFRATLAADSLTPAGARFREAARFELYVHELALERSTGLAFALGRVRPAAVGLWSLDGAVLGYADPRRGLAVGAYGGGIPDDATLDLRTDRFAAGAFGNVRIAGDAVEVRARARAGAIGDGDRVGLDGELEAGISVLAIARAELGARAELVDPSEFKPSFTNLRADLDLGPFAGLSLGASYRRIAPSALDAVAGGPHLLAPLEVVETEAARLWLGYAPDAALELELAGGVNTDLADDGSTRAFVAPTVSLPRLFGALGGLAIGHEEHFGRLAGRRSHVRVHLRPVAGLSAFALSAYEMDARAGEGFDHGLAGQLFVFGEPIEHLELGLGGSGRAPLGGAGRVAIGGFFSARGTW